MSRPAWLPLAVVLIAAAIAWWCFRACGLDPLQLTPERIRTVVASFGLWAPAAYLIVYGQPIVPLPSTVAMIAAGLAFGPWWGLLAAVSGAMLRAGAQFVLARRLGREFVERLLHRHWAVFDEWVTKKSFRAVLLIRLIPNVPFDIQNYALGCSTLRLAPYLAATLLGILPGSFGFVYFGHSLTTPRSLWIAAAVLLAMAGLVCARSVKLLKPEPVPPAASSAPAP